MKIISLENLEYFKDKQDVFNDNKFLDIKEGKLVDGGESVSDLSIGYTDESSGNGGEISMSTGDIACAVQIMDNNGKILPIGVMDGESSVGLGLSPIDYIYAKDIENVDTVDGKLVPNVNTMKEYVSGMTSKLTKISGGYGPPSLGGVTGDLYIDYETGDIYEFGDNDTV